MLKKKPENEIVLPLTQCEWKTLMGKYNDWRQFDLVMTSNKLAARFEKEQIENISLKEENLMLHRTILLQFNKTSEILNKYTGSPYENRCQCGDKPCSDPIPTKGNTIINAKMF